MACTIKESTSTNSKFLTHHSDLILKLVHSHPGYFGKRGMRQFHLLRNHQHCPSVNLDKLWAIVTEETRKKAAASTDKAPVIDVTKAVSPFHYLITSFPGFLQGPWQGSPPQDPRDREGKAFLQARREENQGSRWSLCPHCLSMTAATSRSDLIESIL